MIKSHDEAAAAREAQSAQADNVLKSAQADNGTKSARGDGDVVGRAAPPAVRDAAEADLPEIAAIYAHHVLHGTGTFEEIPPSIEEMAARRAAGVAAGHVWLVACDATGVLGYGYYGPFRSRAAYRFTVEDSVYVRDDVRGQGVGKALVAALVARAEAAGLRQIFALIGDSNNIGSIGVHASLGFVRTGVLRAAGRKFGRWLDVVIMQRTIGAGDGPVTPSAADVEPAA